MDFVSCFRVTPYLLLQVLIVTSALFVVFREELQRLGCMIHGRYGLLVCDQRCPFIQVPMLHAKLFMRKNPW